MTRLREYVRGVGVLLLCFGTFIPSASVADEPRLRVLYHASRLSIEAQDVSLAQVLREVGKRADFTVVNVGGARPALTVSIQDVTLAEALQQLLRTENYVIVSRQQAGEATEMTIDKLYLLGPASEQVATTVQPDSRPQTSRRRHHDGPKRGRHDASSLVAGTPQARRSTAPTQEERLDRESDDADAPGRVADLLRVQALAGFQGLPANGSAASLATQAPPPMADVAPPPQQNAARIDAALLMTTRIAQQNLRALINGLTAATDTLLDTQAQEQR